MCGPGSMQLPSSNLWQKTIGRPVKVDPISLNKMFCLYAQVQIDVDLQFSLPPKVLIEREYMNFELHVTYENLTAFCTHCGTIGHFVGTCSAK